MGKELKQVFSIVGFMMVGCLLGYIVVINNHAKLVDPEFIKLLISKGMEIPEPIGFAHGVLGIGMLSAAIPTGASIFLIFK